MMLFRVVVLPGAVAPEQDDDLAFVRPSRLTPKRTWLEP